MESRESRESRAGKEKKKKKGKQKARKRESRESRESRECKKTGKPMTRKPSSMKPRTGEPTTGTRDKGQGQGQGTRDKGQGTGTGTGSDTKIQHMRFDEHVGVCGVRGVCCGRSVLFLFAMRLWHTQFRRSLLFNLHLSHLLQVLCFGRCRLRSSLAWAFTTSAPRVCRFLSRSYAILFRCCAFLRSAFWASALAAAAAAFSIAASLCSCGGQRHLFLVCLSTSAMRFRVAGSSSRGVHVSFACSSTASRV